MYFFPQDHDPLYPEDDDLLYLEDNYPLHLDDQGPIYLDDHIVTKWDNRGYGLKVEELDGFQR